MSPAPGDPSAAAPGDDELVAAARRAAARAYSPYSKLRVGAALLAADGRVFEGCNVENASYGLTLCAERTAVVRAVADGVREFRAIAVVGGAERAMTPCGACRQVLSELAPGARVLLEPEAPGAGPRIETTVVELLPRAFRGA